MVANDMNELNPMRTDTGWRVCIDYRKLNDATKKDYFPLLFIDQKLECLSGRCTIVSARVSIRKMYYCFLDGFYSYFQILISPEDQENIIFTCPYGTLHTDEFPLECVMLLLPSNVEW